MIVVGGNVRRRSLALLRRPMFAIGLLVALGFGFFHFVLLLQHSAMGSSNPYLNVLFYIFLPAGFLFGVALCLLSHRRLRRQQREEATKDGSAALVAPLTFAALAGTVAVAVAVLSFSGYSSYAVFHFTESTSFCGATCHTPMGPPRAAWGTRPTDAGLPPGAGRRDGTGGLLACDGQRGPVVYRGPDRRHRGVRVEATA